MQFPIYSLSYSIATCMPVPSVGSPAYVTINPAVQNKGSHGDGADVRLDVVLEHSF